MNYEDKLLHVRKLEDYHPGYQDRKLKWAKIYFGMVHGDPDCELIDNEIDWARLIKFILLELDAQRPIPLNAFYLTKKGFDLKKRSIALTIKMLHNFVELVTQDGKVCTLYKEDKEEYKEDNIKKNKSKSIYAPSVTMSEDEHKRLVEKEGESVIVSAIQLLSNYKQAHGKTYKSDYHALLNWAIDEAKKEQPKENPWGENDSG